MTNPGAARSAAAASRRAEFLLGVRDTIPMMLGALPFGVIFGTLAVSKGLSAWQAMALSLFVFSGSAQFIAVILVGAGATLWVVWFATLVLNLRHLLYAATLVDHVRHLSQAWRFPLAAWLTDETFAVMERRYRLKGGGGNAHWYYLGSCISMYLNWQFWSFVGVSAGQQFPSVKDWGLEFAMAATFIGIVMPALVSRPFWAAAISAGLVATLANALPYKLGLMLGGLAGIAVGLLLDEWKRRQAAP